MATRTQSPREGLLHHQGQHQKQPWFREEGLQRGGGQGWGHCGSTGARAMAWAASALCTPAPLNQASTACRLPHQACAPPGPTPVSLSDLTGREDGARREGRSYSFSAAETGQRPDRLHPEPRSSQQSKVRAPGRGGGKAPPEARLTRRRAGRPTSRRPLPATWQTQMAVSQRAGAGPRHQMAFLAPTHRLPLEQGS